MRRIRRIGFLTLLITTFLIGTAAGQGGTTTWDGDTSTDWFTAANWDNGVPGSGDDVVFPNIDYSDVAINEPTIPIGGGPAACKSITINTTTANFTLTLSNTLTIDPGGSISAAGANMITITGASGIIAGGALTFDNDASGSMALSCAAITGNGTNPITFSGSVHIGVSAVITDSGSGNPVTLAMDTLVDSVTLSGSNTYTGATTVTTGTLNLQNNTATGTTAGGVTVSLNGRLQLEGGITVGAEALTLNGDGGAVVELESISGSNRWQGPITLASNAVDFLSTAGTLYLSGGISGQNMTFDCNTGDINVSNVIGPGALTVAQSGTGTLLLSGNNTFTGTLTVGGGGTVELSHPNAFGTGAGTLTIGNGGTLILSDTIASADWDQPITLAGAATINANYSGCEIDENITTVGGTLTFVGTEDILVSGNIGPGAGGVTLNMFTVFDTVILSGTNNYTGATNIVKGTLNMRNNTAAGTTAGGVSVTSINGRLELQGGITVGNEDLWINGDAGAVLEMNNVSGDNTWNGAVTLASAAVDIKSTAGSLTFGSTMSGNNVTFDCNTGAITVTGALGSGGGQSMTKTGTGVLTLNGANNYTGVSTINAGTVNFNGVSVALGAITASNAGTKIAGVGTIPADVTMNDGTSLAPGGTNGDAVGTITINGVLTFNNESKYVITVLGAGGVDKIVGNNDIVATGNTPNVEAQAGYSTVGLVLPATIMDFTGAYTAFDESALPASWDIDNAKVGNLIRLTATGAPAIPTLSEWGMILFSLILAAYAIRRMRIVKVKG